MRKVFLYKMTDIDRLIRMNLELEGLLKVLRERDSDDARTMLNEKIEEYTSAIYAYLAVSPADAHEAAQKAVAEAKSVLAEANAEEVKLQEAVETEEVPEADAAEAAVEREMHSVAPPSSPSTPHQLRFTLNDRFRFCRELFGGDDADFTETVKLLADMDSYSEACDYLYNDMMWDRSDPNVADFMAILAANMPQ